MISTMLVSIMKISFLKRWSFFVPAFLHFFLVLFLTIYTSYILPSSILLTYLIFSGVFLISTLFSLNTILRFRTGIFYYLLNIMLLLGFWFKYSLQKITSLNYREPIGTFAFTPEAETRVLWVIICGMLGFLLSQISSYYLFKKVKNINAPAIEHLPHKKELVFLLIFATLLSLINLKFNILLFALKPSLILPFKGNAIYFLALTRGVIFLFFFYCFRSYSNKMIFWGALIASICSVGVLSRMVVLTYFAVLFILILQNMAIWRLRETILNTLFVLLIFVLFSYGTVLVGTGLRNRYVDQSLQSQSEVVQAPLVESKSSDFSESKSKSISIIKNFNIKQEVQTYKELALGRWIGMEGVMAVDSYPQKSYAFLWNALKEKAYHGKSFYTQVSEPSKISAQDEVISTSVPGPIAFFYYSGSRLFVFFATFLSTFFFSAIEQLAFKFFNKARAVGIFISTFIVFDFFQFGISPLAFVRYWSFSFFSIAVFYYFSTKFRDTFHVKEL